jgi:hypothetical protein
MKEDVDGGEWVAARRDSGLAVRWQASCLKVARELRRKRFHGALGNTSHAISNQINNLTSPGKVLLTEEDNTVGVLSDLPCSEFARSFLHLASTWPDKSSNSTCPSHTAHGLSILAACVWYSR